MRWTSRRRALGPQACSRSMMLRTSGAHSAWRRASWSTHARRATYASDATHSDRAPTADRFDRRRSMRRAGHRYADEPTDADSWRQRNRDPDVPGDRLVAGDRRAFGLGGVDAHRRPLGRDVQPRAVRGQGDHRPAHGSVVTDVPVAVATHQLGPPIAWG